VTTLALLAVAIWAGLGIQTPGPRPSLDPARFEPDIAAFEAEDRSTPPPEGATLFVGSSSIRYWDVARAFPTLRTIRRGYGGSHVSDTLHFFDRIVLRYRPSLVVFYAGDADVSGGKDAATIAADTLALVRRIHAQLPAAAVIVIGTKPSPLHWPHIGTIREANRRVREGLAPDRLAAYVDVEAALLGADGLPRPDCFTENRLNLNDRGYEAWTAAVRPTIERLASRRTP